jgi:hypothetical protein
VTLSRKGVDTRAHGARVPFGVVDAIDGNILAMLRRGRGYGVPTHSGNERHLHRS